MTDALKVKKGQPMPVVDNIYTLEEAADKLKMSVRNVRRWVDEGKIKAFKLGREWRVHEEDLQAVIDNARGGGVGCGLSEMRRFPKLLIDELKNDPEATSAKRKTKK